MRKLVGYTAAVAVLVGAGSALAGQAATTSDGWFIDLNVAVTPPVAGTAKNPQGVGVSFDSFTGNRINGNAVSTNNAITVRFNKGFKDNALLFPACKINTKAMSKCAKSTQIGTGTAEASLPGANGAPPTFVPATLTAYDGKPLSGKTPTIIFIASLGGKPATELDFSIKQKSSGPYGLAFSEIVFPSTSPSSSPSLAITKFSVNIPDQTVITKLHGKRVKVHMIEAPTSCHGAWKFEQVDGFSDAPPLTATDSQPCSKS